MIEASKTLSIPFHDIDIMEIAWHGHYLKYFELARTELMQLLKLDWQDVKQLGIAMPVVEVQVKYKRPLNYGQDYTMRSWIEEYKYPELKVQYEIRSVAGNKVHCTGFTRQVYVDTKSRQSCFSLPESILERFKSHDQSD